MNDISVLRTILVQGKELDIYGSPEAPLFLAVDVALMIDYSTGNAAHMLESIDSTEKILLNTRTLTTSINRGNPEKWFLTEDGFYEVLMQSRKPIARQFKRAVKDILHDLRIKGQGNFEDWLNQEDPLTFEWEEENKERAVNGAEELSWEDFLRSKGYTEDML